MDSMRRPRTLALDEPDHLRDRIFRWNRDHHVNMIRHQMAFLDPAFLLHRQSAKHLPEVLPQFPVKRLPAVLGNEHHMVRRDEFPKEFVTLPGESYPDSALADACYTLLLAPKSAALK